MCGRVKGAKFEAVLGAKNGVASHLYGFQAVESTQSGGTFNSMMIQGCSKLGAGWFVFFNFFTYCSFVRLFVC